MENFHVEVEQLRSTFKYNNYPVNLIDQCIKNFLDKLCLPKQIVPAVISKKELLIILLIILLFRNIFYEIKNTFVQICQQDVTAIQCKGYFQSKS